MEERRTRRGAVLIVVLGLLSLLSLLAAAFATLVNLERATSRNYADAVRARMLAQSGIEDAIGRLRTAGPGFPGLSQFTAAMSAGTHVPGGDLYSVRMIDSNSRINVNDGVRLGPSHSVSRNLARILDVLGAQVDVPRLGERLLRARPPGGYAHRADLLYALDHDAAAFARIRDFVTVASWSDPDVALPVPLSEAAAAEYPVPFARPAGPWGPVYRYGHQRNARGELIREPLLFFDPSRRDPSHAAVWGRDSLHPQWIEIVSRSPVNVNAAPREVLVALFVDLEGFFLVERRREDPALGSYAWTELRYSYDGAGNEGDECGFVYRTVPLVGPGGRHTEGIPAERVADEIVACRERRGAYAALPFGGPFRTWDQFNRFADHLVDTGILADPRSDFFWDLDASGRRTGSKLQLRVASQALADVLKANFNPNLHLNELNPNRNLFTHVDKTDLITHSTEFSFTPMGVFEIESTGRLRGPEGRTRATHTVTAHVRLFDAVRDTSQAHFAAGRATPRKGPVETNNNLGLEAGPEPDNGPAPLDNRYEGYLQLSTLGSTLFAPGMEKPPGELRTTLSDPSFYPGAATSPPPGRGHLGSVVHAHFQFDHAAHHHANRRFLAWPRNWDGFRLPQGAWTAAVGSRCALNANWPDRTEAAPSPYSPVDGRRLARTFSGPPPEAEEAAPSDLRLDGAYVERHSAFGYWIEENVSFNFNEGAAAFWLKPAFFPEMTGKARTLLSAGRYHAHAPARLNPSPFALFFLPGGGSETSLPRYAGGLRGVRPNSLAFGFGFSNDTGYNWEMSGAGDPATGHAFALTPSLHERPGRPGLLRAHHWTHVAVTWRNRRGALPREDSGRIYVNGRLLPGSAGMPHLYSEGESLGQPFQRTPRWTLHSLRALLPGWKSPRWCANTIRLGGEPSRLFGPASDELPERGLFPRNFSADATFDEFYVWLARSPGLAGIQTLWERGRYYRPDDADSDDASFTSRPLLLSSFPMERGLPPQGRPPAPLRRVLGVAWTAAPAEGLPEAGFEFHVQANGEWLGPFRDAGYSPVRASHGGPPEVEPGSEVRYRARLKLGAREGGLLETPALDDVTVFFEFGDPVFLSYVCGGTGR